MPCNTCMESIFRKGHAECLVNPFLGREKRLNFRPAETVRRVMVIGAGPGGLNAARIAAKRGQIALSGYEIHRIGDCIEPRSIKQAIYEGTVVGAYNSLDFNQI